MTDEALNIQMYEIFIHIYCNRTVYRQSIVAMWSLGTYCVSVSKGCEASHVRAGDDVVQVLSEVEDIGIDCHLMMGRWAGRW